MFTKKTVSFLRALRRHNDRDWFRGHKDDYETHVRQPMIEVLERLARDMRTFAPEIVSDPKVSLFRIYRDTRFSEDKRPLKTQIGAHFPDRELGRGMGAGLYFEIAPDWVWIGGGFYMPEAADLHALREHIAATHPRLHRIATSTTFRRTFGQLDGARLSRVPRGYLKDHPAAHYLQFKQFLAGREFEAAFAASRTFYPELLRTFRAAAPLVRFLNTPLRARLTQMPLPGDAPATPGRVRTAQHPRVPEPMW